MERKTFKDQAIYQSVVLIPHVSLQKLGIENDIQKYFEIYETICKILIAMGSACNIPAAAMHFLRRMDLMSQYLLVSEAHGVALSHTFAWGLILPSNLEL